MHLSEMTWRPMAAGDLGAVEAIAGEVHPRFFEASEVLAERQRLYPAGAYLLEIDDAPAGYALSHPWWKGSLPALNTPLGALPVDADTYYIHDLALLPVARRFGAARQIVKRIEAHARHENFGCMSLVAVNKSQGFWERHGFQPECVPELNAKLQSYSPDASYMAKLLA